MGGAKEPFDSQQVVKLTIVLVTLIIFMLIVVVATVSSLFFMPQITSWFSDIEKKIELQQIEQVAPVTDLWKAPDVASIPDGDEGDEIRYGRDLITHTSEYLGPKGKVMTMSNGMNCQNCHLDAGTKPFGNNYSAVAATYPKFRARSGTEETIEKRVNDCFERSLNGKPLDDDSREMKAIVAYIRWVGSGVPKGVSPMGSGLVALDYLDRPANPEKGKTLFINKCVVCHGADGEGLMDSMGTAWINPPLWGENSFNNGAGLFRLSRFAGYIKANMPMSSTFDNPDLTEEQAWDIAAYVISLPRPTKNLTSDWPDITKKPVDHPFGPYADGFSEEQHKYGPFKPIVEKQKVLALNDEKIKQ